MSIKVSIKYRVLKSCSILDFNTFARSFCMGMLLPDRVKERMSDCLFHRDSLVGIQGQKSIKQIVQFIIVTLTKLFISKNTC